MTDKVSTFRIDHTPSGHEYIECLRCRLKSFNENDIAQKFCGKCGFHPLRDLDDQ